MNKGKYISEDDRGGFKVAKVNLPLSDGRLRLFLKGKEDWLEEGLLVLVKKNKRGRIIGEGSSTAQEGGAQQNYMPPFGGIPAPPSYYGGVQMQAWGSGAAMPPPNFAVLNLALRSHMHIFLNHNILWPPLEDTLQESCKLLQPSKPMQTKWVKEMQTSLMSFDTFT
jgi:hypothetical protein